MNLSLPPHLQQFVDAKVKSGQYRSSEEVIEDALDQLRAQTELTPSDVSELRALLDSAIAQADRREFVDFSAESVIRAGRATLEQKQKAG